MTKKDYIAFADIISQEGNYKTLYANNTDLIPVRRLVDRMVAIFTADNPRFDGERFLKACGF